MSDAESSEHRAGALRAHCHGGAVTVRDHACGACATCTAGWPLHCSSPSDDGDVVLVVAGDDARATLRRVTASSSLASLAPDPTSVVLCLDDAAGVGPTLADFVRGLHPGPVVEATSPTDPKALSALAALSPLGRADIVVSTRDARSAVKAVRRGRWVCLPLDDVESPSVTEVVQREVTLVAARSLGEFNDMGGAR